MGLDIGSVAPEFELMTQDPGVKVRLGAFRGKKRVMLLFYPMDFSSVCTAEFCAMGPTMDVVAGDDTVVFGVSCDSPFAHAAFKQQFAIPFDLLSDVTRSMVKSYGMFAGEQPFNCGKRGTVVVGLDGRVEHWQESPMGTGRSTDELAKALGR